MTKGEPQPASREIMAGCLAGRIRLLNRSVTGLYDHALRGVGVTAGQLTTLSFIHELGPLAPGELAPRLMMDKSTLSRNLSRMERNGWITIEPGEAGRTQALRITRKGRSVVARALPRWREAQAEARELLGEGGAEAVVGAFEAVRAGGGMA